MDTIPTFYLIGSRNAEGRADAATVPAEIAGPHAGVFAYNVSSNTLEDGLEILVNNKSLSSFASFGPELTLGPALRDANSGERILIAKTANNSASLFPVSGGSNDWSEENYSGDLRATLDLFSTVLEGVATDNLNGRGLTQDVRGMAIFLGEVDAASETSAAQFAVRLRFLISYHRTKFVADGLTSFTSSTLPIVVALPPRNRIDFEEPYIDVVRAMILEVAAEDAAVYTIEADGLSVDAGTSDLDADGQVEIGRRFAGVLAPFLTVGFNPLFPAPVPCLFDNASPASSLEQTVLEYGGQAVDLLPQGLLWTRQADSNIRKVLQALAVEFAKIDERGRDLEREAIPKTSVELLGSWERILGLPGAPNSLPGFYLDSTNTDGTDDLGAFATSPVYPIQTSIDLVAFDVVSILRPEWLRSGGANGWKTTGGLITASTKNAVFRRMDSSNFAGYRFWLSSNQAATVDVGGGSLAPKMKLEIELGNGTANTIYTLEDDTNELAGVFPLATAFAAPAGDGVAILPKFAQLSIGYRATGGKLSGDNGFVRVAINGVQVGKQIEVLKADRMELAASGEGIGVGTNGTFDRFVGAFDQVRVYERLIPLDELSALWNAGAPLQIHGMETLIVYGWEFDLGQGSPLVTLDRIGIYSGADLTLEDDSTISTKPKFGIVGPPVVCSNELATVDVLRRFEAVAKLAFQGSKAGQSAAFFVELASTLGFEITIETNKPFTPGSLAGDPLSNGDWVFVWTVHAPTITPNFFQAGLSRAGERLIVDEPAPLVCSLTTHRPAHTLVFFRFDLDYSGFAPWSSAGPAPGVASLMAPNVLGTAS
jgi:uncharacterized protein YmfQ (DUF2313 family)